MLLFSRNVFTYVSRAYSRSLSMKVSLLGASGGIGQPMSLLLKQSTLISHLALYDLVNTPGVAADISHIDTPAKVGYYII